MFFIHERSGHLAGTCLLHLPEMIGGHCIQIDPIYLVPNARVAGCHAQVIACAPLFLPMNYEESSHIPGNTMT